MSVIGWQALSRCYFSTTADPVVKGTHFNAVFTAPVSICHAALAVFINQPDLFRHWNTGFASN
ncbi:hypothetical protein K040078D81_44170 [Blautia hominis]|uniref:Uncharacterized protein n=1 Tax=Blautia hominis TaxID=2025493 RepID=A0ABQ0BFQ8_9FIRM